MTRDEEQVNRLHLTEASLTKKHSAEVDVWLIKYDIRLADMSHQHERNGDVIARYDQVPEGLHQSITRRRENERHLTTNNITNSLSACHVNKPPQILYSKNRAPRIPMNCAARWPALAISATELKWLPN